MVRAVPIATSTSPLRSSVSEPGWARKHAVRPAQRDDDRAAAHVADLHALTLAAGAHHDLLHAVLGRDVEDPGDLRVQARRAISAPLAL